MGNDKDDKQNLAHQLNQTGHHGHFLVSKTLQGITVNEQATQDRKEKGDDFEVKSRII